MRALSDFVKSGSQKMTVEDLKLCIRQETYLEALSDLLSPLNPSIILTDIWLVPQIHAVYCVLNLKGNYDILLKAVKQNVLF